MRRLFIAFVLLFTFYASIYAEDSASRHDVSLTISPFRLENPVAYLVGAHAGGFLGYKFSMKAGFTGELQIGPVYLWGETADTSELQTLLALNVGWSF